MTVLTPRRLELKTGMELTTADLQLPSPQLPVRERAGSVLRQLLQQACSSRLWRQQVYRASRRFEPPPGHPPSEPAMEERLPHPPSDPQSHRLWSVRGTIGGITNAISLSVLFEQKESIFQKRKTRARLVKTTITTTEDIIP